MHAVAARTHIVGHGVHNLGHRGHTRRTLLVPTVPTIVLGDVLGHLDRILQLSLCLGQNLILEVALDVGPIQVAVLLVVHIWLV